MCNNVIRTPVVIATKISSKLAGNAALTSFKQLPPLALFRVKSMPDEGNYYKLKGTVRPLSVSLIFRVISKVVRFTLVIRVVPWSGWD
jgi:hypothetical protein